MTAEVVMPPPTAEPPTKRAREDGGEERHAKQSRGDGGKSSRRAARAAHALYARVGAAVLASVQRAQVLLKRVEAESAEVASKLGTTSERPVKRIKQSRFEARYDTAAVAELAAERLEPKPTKEQLSLRIDAQGREIDAQGNLIEKKVEKKKEVNPYALRYVELGDALDVKDPRVVTKRREAKKARAFQFVEEGHYVKIAEATRANQGVRVEAVEDEDGAVEAVRSKRKKGLPRRREHVASVPGMEWWDEEFVPKDVRQKRLASAAERIVDHYDTCALENCRFVGLVHHPATSKPLAPEKKEPATMPFYLTTKDRKRVRRQQRAEREREKQDKIQLGLLPPPEPKFKLSNFMKVLGEQAVADPSKMERKVMEQVTQRLQHHQMRNAARKLTPQERKDKKRRKLAEDTAHEVHVAVFYVKSLENAQHRFKLDVNAQQLNLTGGVLLCAAPDASLALVVVEGGPKGVRRFKALVTRRIQWEETNSAKLVWQGIVVKRAFSQFKFQECKATATARRVLEGRNVPHYWDMVLQRHQHGGEDDDSDSDDDGPDEAMDVGDDHLEASHPSPRDAVDAE